MKKQQHALEYAKEQGSSTLLSSIRQEAYEAVWDKAKSEMLKEVRDWFCEPYCQFYGLEDYCRTCPMNKEECWLKD